MSGTTLYVLKSGFLKHKVVKLPSNKVIASFFSKRKAFELRERLEQAFLEGASYGVSCMSALNKSPVADWQGVL